MIELIVDVLHHSLYDTIKMLPFLLAAFLVVEAMEHYSWNSVTGLLKKEGDVGPFIGALFGCIPQCGFSVMAANLYAGGSITMGTLIATFIATSDEAVLILIGNHNSAKEILLFLFVKVLIGTTAGYMVNIFWSKKVSGPKTKVMFGGECEFHGHGGGIVKCALMHTMSVYWYVLLFTVILDLLIKTIGIKQLAEYLFVNTMFQPVIAALIGVIPNCVSSVLLTQLYINDAISFASVFSGLCAGAGAGLIVLFRVNQNRRENIKIVGILYVMAVFAGILLEILSLF